MTTNADRVYAALSAGDDDETKRLNHRAHVAAPYSRNEDDLDNIDFGVAVGIAYTLERLDDPMRATPDVIDAAMEVAREAWHRFSTPRSEWQVTTA